MFVDAILYLFGQGMLIVDWLIVMFILSAISDLYLCYLNKNLKGFIAELVIKIFGLFTIVIAAMLDNISPFFGIQLSINISLYWTAFLTICDSIHLLDNYKKMGGKNFEVLYKYLLFIKEKFGDKILKNNRNE